jgi:hypothetical protein
MQREVWPHVCTESLVLKTRCLTTLAGLLLDNWSSNLSRHERPEHLKHIGLHTLREGIG